MKYHLTSSTLAFAAATLALCISGTASAGSADISNTPLTTQTSSSIRTNLMFIMDDSGSMGEDFAPDSANRNNRCFGYHWLNKIFYNPSITYAPPVRADGSSYPNASWPVVYADGYKEAGSTVDLSSAPFTKNNESFYYTTPNAGRPTQPTSCTNSHYSRVTSLPSAEQTNYANWYSYYRTRMLAMRAAVGNVFANIDASRFRIGYSTISETGVTDNSKFLNIRNFDALMPASTQTQKEAFFSRLYKAPSSGYTPLRPALEKAGKYYAFRAPSQTVDPVEYSCQRNYTILSTDGYWNTSAEPTNYLPKKLDGSTLGNMDSVATNTPRPMLDDGRQSGNNWVTGGNGVSNSLADIAMYFYETDLRTPAIGNCAGAGAFNVCENNVKPGAKTDTADHQHMTTFTLGLGVNGHLTYDKAYDAATSGDFAAIKQGTRAWPNPITDPTDGDYTDNSVTARIDDLWHAAVNGRGYYYSASNAADVAESLSQALSSIDDTPGSGAAAATSTLIPTISDNWLFVAQFTPGAWEGNVQAYKIDPSTGQVLNAGTPLWEVKNTLKAQTTRNIYFFNATATNKLAQFNYTNLSSAGKASYFDNLCSAGQYKLSQCADIVAAGQQSKVTGTNVVNYLRGVTQYEMSAASTADQLFRTRNTPLGDIINAAPIFVGKPPFQYADNGYSTFVSNQASRTKVVYIAANDGMLHAIKVDEAGSGGGQELWAYVPSMVMNKMHKLADAEYDDNHQYLVDATPTIGDVFDGTSWRTVLVGGLNAGGRGYYALDITNPLAPKALWEFSVADDEDLGLSYGEPIITKMKSGKWVVAFSSGYNNVSPGDGNGYLFVHDIITGASISKIETRNPDGTTPGNSATPSNLGKLNVYVESALDNTGLRLYGGDMLGNLWRFDFDDRIAPAGSEAFLLARLTTPGGAPQPITTRPELAVDDSLSIPLIAVGTGRYLGTSDMPDSSVQSLYVIKENLSMASGLGVLRTNTDMVKQTMSASHEISSPANVDWGLHAGWFVDFDQDSGERVNVDMQFQRGTLAVATNVPTPTPCSPGGSSWLYFFDLDTGLNEDPHSEDIITVGVTMILVNTENDSDGKLVTLQTGSDSKIRDRDTPDYSGGPGNKKIQRTSWRELIN